ncbi:hypothetical protein [Alteromonas halophila]|uniref:Uncharacterized protein n=1 Tax=Alteromonas halophila TaxID=516698 RepID=A0A918MXL5_9ALTE|nr:hypothetical protein [Alteromonas halophila]GGW80698.1 hypothetical protein GCM10007391_12060 [Alteromonas halophila]
MLRQAARIMKQTALTVCLLMLISGSVSANTPAYFTDAIDKEYRALLQHMADTLPATDQPLVYLSSFTPFSLLDIHATKLSSAKDREAFTNFNLGVLGRQFLNIDKKTHSRLPNLFICKNKACTDKRINAIRQFLDAASAELDAFADNSALFIVQQTSAQVYRVNNTFYSPTQLITYSPSHHAGFVPSATYTLSEPQQSPGLMRLASDSAALRQRMATYSVAAITKVHDKSINVIFGGISDNHWGVVINYNGATPEHGANNHIGLSYDVVRELSETRFYYQTN